MKTNSGRAAAAIIVLSLIGGLLGLGSLAALGVGPSPMATGSPAVWQLGNLSISVEITDNPDCNALMPGCLIIPPAHGPKYFTIWGAITTHSNGRIETSARRLLKWQLP